MVLASTSPARLALLRQAGVHPETRAPGVDEDAAVAAEAARRARPLSPQEHVQLLADRKAAAVAAGLTAEDPAIEAVVIGGDSMFELDGVLSGKPLTPAQARERWNRMRGRTGVLHSGHTVLRLHPGAAPHRAAAPAAAAVTFAADITDEERDAYIATGEPLGVAGAFTLDSLGAPFVVRVDGDPSTVVGMSLSTLRRLFTELGISWTSLWSAP